MSNVYKLYCLYKTSGENAKWNLCFVESMTHLVRDHQIKKLIPKKILCKNNYRKSVDSRFTTIANNPIISNRRKNRRGLISYNDDHLITRGRFVPEWGYYSSNRWGSYLTCFAVTRITGTRRERTAAGITVAATTAWCR